jgi:cytochrome bd ubiquinol oxidase subunit I
MAKPPEPGEPEPPHVPQRAAGITPAPAVGDAISAPEQSR